MRTTIDLDEDVLQAARELAALRKTTIGKVISEMARTSLQPPVAPPPTRNGVPLLPLRAGAGVVTLDLVNRLRDEAVEAS